MRKPFNGNYTQTQGFNDECCRASYAQFGMKGHNGHDYALPVWTEVVAPHNGKVLEAGFDAGYGNYVKIDNGVEGSTLAHLAKNSVVVGQEVQEGERIGYSGNSGNSTGPHLHWGYYRIPRDRQNGFLGYIDQTPYLITSSPQPMNNEFTKITKYNPFYENAERVINDLEEGKKSLDRLNGVIREKDSELETKNKEIQAVNQHVETLQRDNEAALAKAELDCQNRILSDRQSLMAEHQIKVDELNHKIIELEQEIVDKVRIEYREVKPKHEKLLKLHKALMWLDGVIG